MEPTSRSVSGVATALADPRPGILISVNLLGGIDGATVILRDGGATGTVLTGVGTSAGISNERQYANGIRYSTNLHVTVTGTTPTWDVELG